MPGSLEGLDHGRLQGPLLSTLEVLLQLLHGGHPNDDTVALVSLQKGKRGWFYHLRSQVARD